MAEVLWADGRKVKAFWHLRQVAEFRKLVEVNLPKWHTYKVRLEGNTEMLHINPWAALISAIVAFLIGFVWYGFLFAKPWTKEMGYDPDMRPSGKAMVKGIVVLAISSFAFCWIFAFYLAGWRFIPGMEGMSTASFALNSALSVWLGFFMPLHLSRVAWERHSWKLFAINSAHHLVVAGVVALILAYWQ